jgi:hypothetical protein
MPARHSYQEPMDTARAALQRQNEDGIRRMQLIGNVSAPVQPVATPASDQELIIARYPFNPAYHPWTQMTVYFETVLAADIVLQLSYTIDNGANWTVIPLNNTGDQVCGDLYRGTFAIDLSGITAATWLGVVATAIVDPATPGQTVICRSHVYLERPGF